MVDVADRATAEEVPAEYQKSRLGQLPAGWQAMPFDEVVAIQRGQVDPKVPPFNLMPHVGPENVEARTGRLLPVRSAADLGLISGKYLFTEQDVLYSKIRPHLCKAALPTFSGTCSADMYALRPRPDALDRGYLYFVLLSPGFTAQATSYQDRTGIPKINRRQLGGILLPLPPLPEQRAIAHVLSTVQRAGETTQAVIAATRELKRSLMRHFFTYGPVPAGEVDSVRLKESEIGLVPEHWQMQPLKLLIELGPQNGLYKHQDFYGRGTGIVRVDEFGDQGDVITSAPKLVDLSPSELRTYALRPGDLLVNRVNGSLEFLGKTAIVGHLDSPLVFESNMMRLTLNTARVLPSYLLTYLVSPTGRAQIQSRAKRGNQFSVNQGSLGSVVVPVMPLDEQHEIAERLSRINNKLRADEEIRHSLSLLDHALMQRLLTGELRATSNDLDMAAARGDKG